MTSINIAVADARKRLLELLQQFGRELALFGKASEPLQAIAQQIAARALETNGIITTKEMHV